jgi:hypothetical protein
MTISATTDYPTIAKVIAIAGMLLMGDALVGEGGAGLSAAESGAVIGFTQGTLNSANLGKGVKQGVISGPSSKLPPPALATSPPVIIAIVPSV